MCLCVSNCVTVCCCREDNISGGVRGKAVRDKPGVYSGMRARGPGVRRHTVNSDVNTAVVGIS